MKVLAITEDPTHDMFIVKPIVERAAKDAGVKASIFAFEDPQCRAGRVLEKDRIESLVRSRPMIDLFVLCVDRDCKETQQAKAIQRAAEHPGKLVAVIAIEEVEVWMLALHRERLDWAAVRRECHPKERFADPLLDRLGRGTPGQGRQGAMASLGAKWKGLRDLCDEVGRLRDDIRAWAAQRSASP